MTEKQRLSVAELRTDPKLRVPLHDAIIRMIVNPGMMKLDAQYIGTRFDPLEARLSASSDFHYPRDADQLDGTLQRIKHFQLGDAFFQLGLKSTDLTEFRNWATIVILSQLQEPQGNDLLKQLHLKFSGLEMSIIASICLKHEPAVLSQQGIKQFTLGPEDVWIVETQPRLSEGYRLEIMQALLARAFEVSKGVIDPFKPERNGDAILAVENDLPRALGTDIIVSFTSFVLSVAEHIAGQLIALRENEGAKG